MYVVCIRCSRVFRRANDFAEDQYDARCQMCALMEISPRGIPTEEQEREAYRISGEIEEKSLIPDLTSPFDL